MNKIRLLKLWERAIKLYPQSDKKEEIKKLIEYIKQDL